MYYEIPEVSRHESGLIYILVELWLTQADHDAGEPPILSNDFLIQLRRQYQRVVTSTGLVAGEAAVGEGEIGFPNGWHKRLDGVFVDPANITPEDEAIGWERETITKTNAELRQEARQILLAYWRRAKAAALAGQSFPRRHDQRQRLIRNLDDPDGLLARVVALQGEAQEVIGE